MNPKEYSEYQAFITDKHKRLFNAPQEIINAAIKEATGSAVVKQDRIIKGESNEVHSISVDSGEEVIIRIHHESDSVFNREKWAIERCAEVGVPVPQVLFVGEFDNGGKKLGVSVESKLPGVPMSELPGSPDEHLDLYKQAGEILSRIHSIRLHGFGSLDSDGKGQHDSIKPILIRPYLGEKELLPIAEKVGLDQNYITRGFEILYAAAEVYPEVTSRLLHNDFSTKHFLVGDGKITGILDFENVDAGDPVREFARWQYFFKGDEAFKSLVEGYRDKSIFTPDFEQRLRLWKINLGMVHLSYYFHDKNQSGLDLTKSRLVEDVNSYPN